MAALPATQSTKTKAALLALLALFGGVLLNGANASENGSACPPGCQCSLQPPSSLECSGFELEQFPAAWPTHFERVVLRNWSMSVLDKNAFRRFHQLRELHILDCPQLDLIDRHAFKQLRKLRTLVIRGNKSLRELYKASFSAIGNEHSLSIQIADNAIERIRAFTFKNAQNLRELSINERCFELEGCALAEITRLDFLTLRGVCTLEPFAFQNTSRVHQLHLTDSALSQLPRNGFAELSHVNQLQVRECRIGRVEEGALAGLFTVGSVQVQSNQIARLSPGWTHGVENLGSLMFSYNTVREPLSSPECLRHNAQRFLFTENTLHCSCALQWLINAPDEEQWLAENYCGREEAFKALLYYSPAASGCAPWVPPSSSTATPPPVRTETTARRLPADSSRSGASVERTGAAESWADPEDEPFPDPSVPQRRHSGRNSAAPKHYLTMTAWWIPALSGALFRTFIATI